jgi:hypothetical protein
LAGNSRVECTGEPEVVVEAQLKAFEAGLVYADKIRARTGVLPKVSVAFDHKGVFRRQFLAGNLTNSQKRNPTLAQLRSEVVEIFLPAAQKWHIPLAEIFAIHEDSARTRIEHLVKTTTLAPAIARRLVVLSDAAQAESSSVAEADAGGGCGSKVTCAAVTSEYFRKAASHGSDVQHVLEVFFEDAPWSRALAYVRGLQLSQILGAEFGIRLNVIGPDGEAHRGDLIYPSRRVRPPASSD